MKPQPEHPTNCGTWPCSRINSKVSWTCGLHSCVRNKKPREAFVPISCRSLSATSTTACSEYFPTKTRDAALGVTKAIYEMEPEIQNLDDEFVNKIVWMALEEISLQRSSAAADERRRLWQQNSPAA